MYLPPFSLWTRYIDTNTGKTRSHTLKKWFPFSRSVQLPIALQLVVEAHEPPSPLLARILTGLTLSRQPLLWVISALVLFGPEGSFTLVLLSCLLLSFPFSSASGQGLTMVAALGLYIVKQAVLELWVSTSLCPQTHHKQHYSWFLFFETWSHLCSPNWPRILIFLPLSSGG